MKIKSYLVSIIYILIGGILIGLGFGFLVMGVIQLIRRYRLEKNEAYREKVEIEAKDERNHFIRNKAWAWAGYLFVMIMAVACIVLRIMGQDLLSTAASGSVCLVLVLFWISFYILRRKY